MPVTDYHQSVRDAVANALEGVAGLGVAVVTVDDPDDAFDLSLPVVAVACVGPEQERPEFTTNAQDGRGYPVAVALLTAGTSRGERSAGPPTPTAFRRAVTTAFNNRRLTGVARVGFCEVSDAGELFDPKNPRFQFLQTALVVTAVGRFPRTDS